MPMPMWVDDTSTCSASGEVWSRQEGYPGHPLYREFYRDIGFDLDPGSLGGEVGPGVVVADGGGTPVVTGAEPHGHDRLAGKDSDHPAGLL